MSTYHGVNVRVINVKALVGAFNQEKVLVGAFSVIVKTNCETGGSFYSTSPWCGGWPAMGNKVTMISAKVMWRNMVRLRLLPRLLLNNSSRWQHSTLGTKWPTARICKKFTDILQSNLFSTALSSNYLLSKHPPSEETWLSFIDCSMNMNKC